MLMEEAQEHARDAWLPDLERIHAAGKRLLGVVNDLFDPSKAEALVITRANSTTNCAPR